MINQDLKQSENEERGKRSASMVNEEKVYDKDPLHERNRNTGNSYRCASQSLSLSIFCYQGMLQLQLQHASKGW